MKRLIVIILVLSVICAGVSASDKEIVNIQRTKDFLGDVKWYPTTADGMQDFGYWLHQRYIVGGGYNYILYESKVTDKTEAPYYGRVDPRYILLLEKRFRNLAYWGGFSVGMFGGMALFLIVGGILWGVDDPETGEMVMGVGGGIFGACGAIFGVAAIIYAVLTAQAKQKALRAINDTSAMRDRLPVNLICDIGNNNLRVGASIRM